MTSAWRFSLIGFRVVLDGGGTCRSGASVGLDTF
jgi:hypothetical protein